MQAYLWHSIPTKGRRSHLWTSPEIRAAEIMPKPSPPMVCKRSGIASEDALRRLPLT